MCPWTTSTHPIVCVCGLFAPTVSPQHEPTPRFLEIYWAFSHLYLQVFREPFAHIVPVGSAGPLTACLHLKINTCHLWGNQVPTMSLIQVYMRTHTDVILPEPVKHCWLSRIKLKHWSWLISFSLFTVSSLLASFCFLTSCSSSVLLFLCPRSCSISAPPLRCFFPSVPCSCCVFSPGV